MSSSSDFDCYLCGAQNEPTADHCARCSGQLLRIPSVDGDDVDGESSGAQDGESSEAEGNGAPPEEKKSRRKLRKGTVQEQRLSDALGLPPELIDIDEDPEDPLVDTVVTSIPRATPSADIPLLGTRAGAVPQAAMKDREFGKATYILLGLMVLATGWLAYSTLIGGGDEPESIAFTGTTTTSSTSTTSTEAPRRIWQPTEIQDVYDSTFVRVDLYECSTGEDQEVTGELVGQTVGVALDTNNILIGDHAEAVVVRSRTGASRVALVSRTPDGIVATSLRGNSRNLGLTAASNETPDETYFVGFEPETNAVETTTEMQGATAEIEVSNTGDAHTVFLAGTRYDTAPFIELDLSAELIPDAEINSEPCETSSYVRIVAGESTILSEPDTTSPTPDEAVGESTEAEDQ